MDAELQLAAALERAAAAEARAEASERARAAAQLELAELRLGLPRPPPPRRLRTFHGVAAALSASAPQAVPSPSKAAAEESIQASLASVDLSAPPLSPGLAALAAGRSLAAWVGEPADAMLREEAAYPRATAHVPAWVVARTRGGPGSAPAETAATLFLGRGRSASTRPVVPGVAVPWSCLPELLTASEPFHPAFNGEVKSAMSAGEGSRLHMFDELATYAMLGMLGAYFRDVPAGAHRFFRAPPHAFCLAAFSHVGYLVVVEWAGKLLVCAASEPFFLGSDGHREAIAHLPDSDLALGAIDLSVDDVPVSAWPPAPEVAGGAWRPGVIWRSAAPASADGGGFFKIVRGHAFGADFFRRLHAAYAALAEARADVLDPPPTAVAVTASAELLFGAGEVCVRMPWVHGREAAPADLAAGGCALAPVADALAWLARHRLLYVDVREANILVDGEGGALPGVSLVDFDDVVVASKPPASADDFCALLAEQGARFVAPAGMPGALPALVAALRAAWR